MQNHSILRFKEKNYLLGIIVSKGDNLGQDVALCMLGESTHVRDWCCVIHHSQSLHVYWIRSGSRYRQHR